MNAVNPPAVGKESDVFATQVTADELDSALSALVDGELSTDELDTLLHRLTEDESTRQACERYQLIGDALRGTPVSRTDIVLPHAFVAGVHARLQGQGSQQPQQPRQQPPLVTHVRAPSANGAVFRWKLVAGAASLAAVFAVSWTVIDGAPQGAGGRQASQLALTQPAERPATPAEPASNAVLVNTPQGPVLRDARLEELMAEHRQYGGMSALQMPAGFLRDATHPSAPQR